MVLKIADRSEISPFIVMDVMRTANQMEIKGADILHLEVGQPSTPAPFGVRDAAIKAIGKDILGYTDALGIPALRCCLSDYYKDYYQCDISKERIVITTGSSAGFILSFLCVFDIGDKIGVLSPGYPAYKNILGSLGLEIIEIRVDASNLFQPTIDILEALDVELDGIIIASPSNPTGSMLSSQQLEEICVWCDVNGVRLISDEIYHGITYGEPAKTAASFNKDAIIVNSFSKYFSMTGWRLGWMIVPESLLRVIECLCQNFFISPPTLSQISAVAAFDCLDDLDSNVARYAENREELLTELPKLGFKVPPCAYGAFYIYADVSPFAADSEVFCKQLLLKTGVAITPGKDFDSIYGSQFVRFSYAGSRHDINEAITRLRKFLL